MNRTRTIRCEVTLNTAENRMLRSLAKKRGLSAADVVRQLIRDASSNKARA